LLSWRERLLSLSLIVVLSEEALLEVVMALRRWMRSSAWEEAP
jgi:hypothetical protein